MDSSLQPAGSFKETGNFVTQGANHVDPQLLDILQTAAQMTGMQVQAYSGYRPGDARFHGKGLATDVRIIGPDGQPLPNYQTPQTFSAYETLAQAARQVQQQKYPDLDKQFRWGGYFSGDKGKYGAMDLMHFDLGGSDKLGMAGGSWDKGLTSEQASYFPGVKSQGAMAFAPQNPVSDSAGAVDAMATGGLKPTLVHSTNVPPPFSGQQPDFAPLIPEQAVQPQAAPQQPVNAPQTPLQGEPGPVQAAPLAAPQRNPDDILKAFLPEGADTTPVTAAQPQETPDDILNSFLPKETPADALKSSQAAAPSTIGQTIGGAIDTGVAAAQPYLDKAGQAASAVGSFGNNIARQVSTGVPVIGGALNKLDAATNALVAPAINPMLSDKNQLAGNNFAERYANSLQQQNATDASFQAAHPVISTGAQIAGGIGSVGGIAAKVPAVANALGMTGSTLARTVAGAASGTVLGGADAAVRSNGDAGSIAKGAVLGGVLGGAAPTVGNALGATANKLVGSAIPTRVAELAQLASQKYGIDLGPGQLSTNPTIRFLDSVVNKIPLSGGTAAKEAQQTAFNKAVASTIGEDATELTPEVLGAAKTRIGKVFDSVADRTPQIQGGNDFVADFNGILDEAKQTIAESELGPLQKQADNILGKFQEGNGSITGETYQALTRKGAPLDRAMNSSDPNIRFYAGQMRESLDGALQQSASPEVLADLQQARSQWKAMKTVEDLAGKAPTGDVSPALLMGAARKSYSNMAYGGDNDLVNLARIGQQFMKEPPSSGTAERSSIMNLLAGGASGGGIVSMAANPASIPYVLGPLAGAAAIGRGVGTVLRSPALGNRMVQGALNAGKDMAPSSNQLLFRATGQGVLPEVNKLAATRR